MPTKSTKSVTKKKQAPKMKVLVTPNPRPFMPVNNFRLTHPSIKRIGHQVTAQLPRYRKAG